MSMTTTAPTRMFARNASARALGRGARKRYEWIKRCMIQRAGSRFTRNFGWMRARVDDGCADVGYRTDGLGTRQ